MEAAHTPGGGGEYHNQGQEGPEARLVLDPVGFPGLSG